VSYPIEPRFLGKTWQCKELCEIITCAKGESQSIWYYSKVKYENPNKTNIGNGYFETYPGNKIQMVNVISDSQSVYLYEFMGDDLKFILKKEDESIVGIYENIMPD
jgi:hypothetical protein